MTTEFFISIEIRVLGQPILYLTREGTLVGTLVSNPELIKPKWSTTALNTYDQATVCNLVGFEMQQFLNYKNLKVQSWATLVGSITHISQTREQWPTKAN